MFFPLVYSFQIIIVHILWTVMCFYSVQTFFPNTNAISSGCWWQPDTVCISHGDAGVYPVCVSDEGAVPCAGGTPGWKTDRCWGGETGGGKELLQELHHPEDAWISLNEHT